MKTCDVAAIMAAIAAAAVYLLAQGTEALALFANYGLIAYMGSAALIGFINYFRIGRSLAAELILGFALGLVFWALGLVVYTYAYFVTGEGLEYLSLADVFYFLSYPSMFFGISRMLRLFGKAATGRHWLVTLAFGTVLYALIGVYVLIPSVSELGVSLDALVTVLYPILDTIVFLMLFHLFLVFRKTIFEKSYAFIALGAMLLAVGDLTYTFLNVTSMYYDGHPLDLLLFFGCVSAGRGFWIQLTDLLPLGNR
jgi:hypothetical protein